MVLLLNPDIAYNAGKEPLLNDVDFVPAKGLPAPLALPIQAAM